MARGWKAPAVSVLLLVMVLCCSAAEPTPSIEGSIPFAKLLCDIVYPGIRSQLRKQANWNVSGYNCSWGLRRDFDRAKLKWTGITTCINLGTWRKSGCPNRGCAFQGPFNGYLAALAQQEGISKNDLTQQIVNSSCGFSQKDIDGMVNIINGRLSEQGYDDEQINHVRDYFKKKPHRAGWVPGKTSRSHMSKEFKNSQVGTIREPLEVTLKDPHVLPSRKQLRLDLPASFDARLNWPNCSTIKQIRDQGNCGSCWAHAGASTISDRICIFSSTKNTTFQASVQDPLICSGGTSNLCGGSAARLPFIMYSTKGLVSGGGYGSNSGCLPYAAYTAADSASTSSTRCTNTCSNAAYTKSYAQDKRFGSNWYAMGNQYVNRGGGAAATVSNETVIKQIQYELMTNGPLVVSILVYYDFFYYTSGVYQQVSPALAGSHAMKLIGWGTENGTDYWLIANSWGTWWGMEGFVKILRGTNHLGIEDYLVTGTPQAEVAVATTDSLVLPCNAALCSGKNYYPIYPPDVCAKLFCYCIWATPTIVQCFDGQYFDAAPAVYGCVASTAIAACSSTAVPSTTTMATTTKVSTTSIATTTKATTTVTTSATTPKATTTTMPTTTKATTTSTTTPKATTRSMATTTQAVLITVTTTATTVKTG